MATVHLWGMIGLGLSSWRYLVSKTCETPRCWGTSVLLALDSGKLVLLFDDAYLPTSFAFKFRLRGTCMKFTFSNSPIIWFVSFRYLCILVSFVSYSPLICPITSLESLFKSTFLALRDLATLSPVNIASYSDSLLVAGNWSCTPYFRMSPSGEVMMTPTPPFLYTDDPSVWAVHNIDMSCVFTSSGKVNLAINLTNTWALIAVRGLYSMLN